jgi:hypothetical protein
MRTSKALICVFASVLMSSFAVAAEETFTAGKDDVAKSEFLNNPNASAEQGEAADKAASAGRNVTMWCGVANGGHTVQITASNASASAFTCSSVCGYKAGAVPGTLQCTGTVPGHANHAVFCSRYSSNSTFVITDVGHNNCP